jgi:hypothetical protein
MKELSKCTFFLALLNALVLAKHVSHEVEGRAIAQAVSCWLPTAVARVE